MHSQFKFIQTCVHISLSILGKVKNPKYRLTYVISFVGCLSIILIGDIVGLLARREITEKLEILSVSLPHLTVLLTFVDIYSRRKTLIEFLERLKGNRADHILDRANVVMKKNIIPFVTIMSMLFAVAAIPSIIYYANPRIVISEKHSLLIPYWFSCGDGDGQGRRGILKSICLPVRTRGQLVLVNGFVTAVLVVACLVSCSELILYGVFVHELLIHAEVFKSMVHELTRVMKEFCSMPSNSHHEDFPLSPISPIEQNVRNQLIQIIKYQQFIKSCTLEVVRIWKTYNALYVTDVFFALALLLLIVVKEKDEEPFMAFKAACVCVIFCIGYVYICIYGHSISTLNEILFDELCTIPWYWQSIQFRKLYTTMLTQNRKSIQIKIFGIYPVGLSTIFSLGKSAYSLLNALRLMSK